MLWFLVGAYAGIECLLKIERQILLRQTDGHLVSPVNGARERHIFWPFYRHGMTVRAIVAVPGVGVAQKGVEDVIQRPSSQFRERRGRPDSQSKLPPLTSTPKIGARRKENCPLARSIR